MNTIHCSDYGDVIAIPLPPSWCIPDDITAQRLHFSSRAEVVWSSGLHLQSREELAEPLGINAVSQTRLKSGPRLKGLFELF